MFASADPALHAALVARDRRFDGRLYVGVTSTGIYCRPVCGVRTPRPEHCRYFAHPATAEAHGFRPCLRCRPELAPGHAPIDMPSRLAWAAAQRLDADPLGEATLAQLAGRLGISDRHLRRIFRDTFGVTPVAYAQTRRLLLAKRLLTDTALPVTEVALAAGFGSLRRLHALFRERYRLAPGDLRRAAPPAGADDDAVFEMAYRPPLDWAGLLADLAREAVPGLEAIDPPAGARPGRYRRTWRLAAADGTPCTGRIMLAPAPKARPALALTVSPGLLRALPAVLAGVQRLADLACDPQAVARTLGPLAEAAPGLRIPGTVDGFEMAVRTVLGPAETAALVRAFGPPVPMPEADLHRLFPDAAGLAATSPAALMATGLAAGRAATVLALAHAVAEDRLDLGPTADLDTALARLQALPGLDAPAAQAIALRALGWPDAWPDAPASAANPDPDRWRPWRGYAAMHLRRRAGTPTDPTPCIP